MKQEFLDYELHLQMFLDAGGDAHARHLYGEPQKPEGYDDYKKMQEDLKNSQEVNAPVIKIKSNVEKVFVEEEIKGYELDKDGVPKYLTAHDVYMGNINPAWEIKHNQPVENKIEKKNSTGKIEKEGYDYDEDGIPAYLNAHDRHEGNINPEWLAKHGNKK